ncbi:MAG: carbon-nitrogen hydrolase family protein [Terriglobales bacterium]|jgi:predicted amidohydrolase
MKRASMVFLLVGVSLGAPFSTSRAEDRSPNPIVRVVTVSQDELSYDAGHDVLEATLARLNASSVFHPDIACLPEMFSNRAPESVPGPITERLSDWARANSSYVLFGMRTKKNGTIYNTAILMDRQGKIIGQYDKIHPTDYEIKDGTTPGVDAGPPVFKTDFGTIGILICFDVNWRDDWQKLKQEGAQIIFWPSNYPAARQLSALALTNEVYIVSSTNRGPSSIYDITGVALASTGEHQEWVGTSLPLGKRLFETDRNAEIVPAIERDYGSKVEVVWYHDSDWITIASLDPQLTTDDLIAKYGLIPLRKYIAQSARIDDEARSRAGTQSHR